MRAVVLAGDYRTFEHAVISMEHILRGADIFVSFWSTSECVNRIEPDVTYSFASMTEERVRLILKDYNVVSILLEEYDAEYWSMQRRNASFVHRLYEGAKLVKQSEKEYTSVLFIRPDLYFMPSPELVEVCEDIKADDFITCWSDASRVSVKKTLNDTMFAVRPADMFRAIPTVEFFQHQSRTDWHTFFCWFITQHGKLHVRDLGEYKCFILRPPSYAGISFHEAADNARIWDRCHVFWCIQSIGLRKAQGVWGKKIIRDSIKYERAIRIRKKL